MVVVFVGGQVDCDSLTLAKSISGWHIVMAQNIFPTPALYLSCIDLARASCSLGLDYPTAELYFLSQVGHDGRGVGLFSVVVILPDAYEYWIPLETS